MIAVVVYNREAYAVAKRRSHDLVIFMEQPGIAVVSPLFDFVEDVLIGLKLHAHERFPRGGFHHRRFPYDTPEFIFPLDETTLLDLLREFVPNIEIRNWRRSRRGQLGLPLCFSCNENCTACATKTR